MASLVEILIKAKDEASGVIDGVKESFGELEGGADDLKENGSKSFGDFMDNVAIAMLGINMAIEVGMKIAEAAQVVYENTVGKALDIAGEIEELSRISGEAPENMSALRVAAEESKVPFDDLYKAMENLNKNGVPPTVENLVAIADEYVALKDPIEKATLLTENFGSAGDDIAPMLEDIAGGVREVQNAGLIFTEEDIQAVKDYEAAVSGLKSEWENLLVTAGKDVIPLLTHELIDLQIVTTTKDVHELTNEILDLGISEENLLKIGSFSKPFFGTSLEEDRQYLEEAGVALTSYGDLLKAHQVLMDDYGMSAEQAGYFLNQMITQDGVAAIDELIGKTEMYGDAAEGATTATDNATWSVDAYGNAALEAGSEVEVFGSNSKRSAEEVDAMRIAAQETQKQIEDLQKALEVANLELDVAIRTFSESIGGDLAQGLKDAGLEGDELLNRLGLIDQAFGTSYVLEYKLELATDDLLDTLINDPDNFLPDAQQFLDYFTPLQDSVIEAMGKVDELETQLSELERTWNIRVKITTEGGFPGGTPFHVGQIAEAAGGVVHAAASGLAASLPYYWVGERGPEPFFPATDGRIVSNTQAMAALRGGTNSEQIADAVKQGIKDAMRDSKTGNVYNLTMPTSSNPADVRTAFELMEAWNA